MDIDGYLATHADSLKARSLRTRILASNIANSDTPNYKARDVAFSAKFDQAARGYGLPPLQPLPMSGSTATHGRHLDMLPTNSDLALLFRTPQEPALDGNTVEKDIEEGLFAENAVRYQASLQFLGSKVNSLIRTLRGE